MEFDIPRAVTEVNKVWLSGGAIVLLVVWPLFTSRLRTGLLVLLCLVSTLNYGRFGLESLTKRLDTYDLIHYYLNAKYFEELGYYDLYPAILLADLEESGPHFRRHSPVYMAQSDAGHALEPLEHAFERGRVVKETRFTPERWDDFTHDMLHIQRDYPREWTSRMWTQMIHDHGFNGTLVWTLVAQPITQVVPVESIKWLCQIDLFLMVAALALIGRAYGLQVAAWLLLWLTCSYSMRWPTIPWAFLRYDWLFALLGAMALIKLKRPVLAGALAGWSATLRLFPVLWFWGPAAKIGLRKRPRLGLNPTMLFLLGALGSILLLQGAATARYGFEPAYVHIANMLDHNDPLQISSRRAGLALALSFDGRRLETVRDENGDIVRDASGAPRTLKTPTVHRKQQMADQKPLRYGLGALFLLVMGWAMRDKEDDEVFGFGFLPFFLLTTASYYYYIARGTMAVVHGARLSVLRHRVGLMLLFAMELFCNLCEGQLPKYRSFLIGWLSVMLAVYAIVQCVWLLRERQPPESALTPSDASAR